MASLDVAKLQHTKNNSESYAALNKISDLFLFTVALATREALPPRGCSESCDKL